MPGVGKTLQRRGEAGTLSGKPIRRGRRRGDPGEPAPTLHVVVGFAAGHPLAPLETPVVGVRQHYLHEDVVVGRGVEAGDVKAQERKHSPGEGRKSTRHARRAGEGGAGSGGSSVPPPRRPRRRAASPDRPPPHPPAAGEIGRAAFRGRHRRAGGTPEGEGAQLLPGGAGSAAQHGAAAGVPPPRFPPFRPAPCPLTGPAW